MPRLEQRLLRNCDTLTRPRRPQVSNTRPCGRSPTPSFDTCNPLGRKGAPRQSGDEWRDCRVGKARAVAAGGGGMSSHADVDEGSDRGGGRLQVVGPSRFQPPRVLINCRCLVPPSPQPPTPGLAAAWLRMATSRSERRHPQDRQGQGGFVPADSTATSEVERVRGGATKGEHRRFVLEWRGNRAGGCQERP